MPFQAPTDLAGVFRPHDPARVDDWGSLALIYAYVHALETNGKILDIGSGDGWPALPLAPYMQQVVGIDPSSRRTEVANENLSRFGYDHVTFRIAHGEALPFRDRSFDGIVVGTAVEQAEDREAVLAEAFRVLRPGGRFVATFENVLAARPIGSASAPPQTREPLAESVDLEEKAALSTAESGDLIYRYSVLSLRTLRETEYLLSFRFRGEIRPSPDLGTASSDQRGARSLADLSSSDGRDPIGHLNPDADTHPGIAVLDDVLASPFLQSVVAEACTIRHFTSESLVQALTHTGFAGISVHGRISRAVGRVARDLATRGILPELADQFHPICASLAKQWPLIEAGQDPAPFVVARRPPGRPRETHRRRGRQPEKR